MTVWDHDVSHFFGGPLNLVSSAIILILIAMLATLIYISRLMASSVYQAKLTYRRILFIEEYVRRQMTVRQNHIKADDIDSPRPPITRPTVVQRPRDPDIAPRGARQSVAIKRERNADGIRHDRKLHNDS